MSLRPTKEDPISAMADDKTPLLNLVKTQQNNYKNSNAVFIS